MSYPLPGGILKLATSAFSTRRARSDAELGSGDFKYSALHEAMHRSAIGKQMLYNYVIYVIYVWCIKLVECNAMLCYGM